MFSLYETFFNTSIRYIQGLFLENKTLFFETQKITIKENFKIFFYPDKNSPSIDRLL